MPSSKPRTDHSVKLYLQFPQSPDPPHVALANLRDEPEAIRAFRRKWGGTSAWRTPHEEIRKFRENLRSFWRGEPLRFTRHLSGTYAFSKRGAEFTPEHYFQTIAMLFDRDWRARKLGVCGNPDCPAPYFIKKRKTQKYCTAGPCTEQAQREHKRVWWRVHRGKGAK